MSIINISNIPGQCAVTTTTGQRIYCNQQRFRPSDKNRNVDILLSVLGEYCWINFHHVRSQDNDWTVRWIKCLWVQYNQNN